MNHPLAQIIQSIGDIYQDAVAEGARNYLEVNIGQQAKKMDVSGLPDQFLAADVIVPIKAPVSGMKVRIDGRTFVDYARFENGVAVPGYIARESGLAHSHYIANDSMILNFA